MKTDEEYAEIIRANLADRAGYGALDDKAAFADAAKFIAAQIADARREERAATVEACAKVADAKADANWSQSRAEEKINDEDAQEVFEERAMLAEDIARGIRVLAPADASKPGAAK